MAGPGELIAAADSAPPGPGVVALSGGADSAACAWALVHAGRNIRTVFVDHGLPASESLGAAAAAVASALGCEHARIRAALTPGRLSEGDARTARYRALLAELRPGEWLATGHTADDQAETVLAHLLRGSGTDGLAGIPPDRGLIVRPLLDLSREHVRAVADTEGLVFLDDPANADLRHVRNRIRHRLLPQLERDHNPQLRAVLARTAASLRRDAALLADLAEQIPMRPRLGGVELPATLLLVVPSPLAARAIRGALRTLHPPHPGSHGDVVAALEVAGGAPACTVGGGIEVSRRGPMLRLRNAAEPRAQPSTAQPPFVRHAGRSTVHPWRDPWEVRTGGILVTASWMPGAPPCKPLSPWRALIDIDALGPLSIRTALPGETIAFDGGSKDVRQAMAEAGVPADRRATWPVIAGNDTIVWIPGVRRGRAGWVDGSSAGYLWALATEETT